ncbi:MAG TPA: TIGR03435 family protein [Bryobacteraceae bacterium]|jgi:uncharacterized protein (TIGR03435 family)
MLAKRLCLALSFIGLAAAQNPPARLAFEVASIRPGLSGNLTPAQFEAAVAAGKFHRLIDDSRIDLAGMPLPDLIMMAYRIPGDRLVMAGGASQDQRFDIVAKLPEGAKKEQVPEMLQTLLAERFKLAVHHESKPLPVYSLTVAKEGPKLRDSTAGDSDYAACNGGFHKVCRKMSMQALADNLTRIGQMNTTMPGADLSWGIDRPVMDATGLKGVYDFEMDYGISRGGGGRGGAGAAAPPAGESRSVTDALKDLGLKLEPSKHEFENVVVDHVERMPTEN